VDLGMERKVKQNDQVTNASVWIQLGGAGGPLRALVMGIALLTIALTTLAAGTAMAAPPGILVEGVLQTTGGGPVADGTYSVEFAVYDKAKDGTKVWSEKAKVAVSKGAFQHALGSVTQLLPATIGKVTEPWLSAKVESDPELGRKRIHSVAWAFHAAVAHGISCTGCVGTSALKADGDLDLGAFAFKAAKVTAQSATFGTVAASGFVGDGSKLTGIKTASGACKAGEVMIGINANGSVKCGKALDLKNLPADALTALSGGALSNQFIDKVASSTAPKNIKDNFPSGVTDVIDVPDLGFAESIKVSVNIVGSSNIAGLRVLLYDPAFGPLPADISKNGLLNKASFTLHDKSGAGPNLIASYPPAKPTKGDLSTWHGKNPKGKWSLVLIDTAFKDNQSDGKLVAWNIEIATVSNNKVKATGTMVIGNGLQLPVLAKAPYPCGPKWRGLTYVDDATDAVHICRKSGFWGTFSIHECGNKTVESGESCDDGNNTSGDGCDALCVKECGNGKIDKGEECDPNHAATKKNCTDKCKKLKYGKLWLESNETQWFPVKYPHSQYKESLAVATCKAVGLRLWRDEPGGKNDPNYAYDYNNNHNLGGHDICYKVNSATGSAQQGHTGTWKLFGKAWSDDIKLTSGAGNGTVVFILNKQSHSGTYENGAGYCRIRPQSNSVQWIDQTNGQPSGLKDNAIVLCAKHK
jgi:cysteine-rich repeat protein